jgi:hypothetical protein
MIDKRVAHDHALRFQCFDKWLTSPDQRVMLEELTMAVMASHNEIIAAYVVENWIAYETKMPMPADLRRLIWAENDKVEAPPQTTEKHSYCVDCYGFGIAESIRGGPLDSTASYCPCEAGRHRERVTRDPRFEPDNVNISRQKLMKTFPDWRKRDPLTPQLPGRAQKMLPAAEAYHGEF